MKYLSAYSLFLLDFFFYFFAFFMSVRNPHTLGLTSWEEVDPSDLVPRTRLLADKTLVCSVMYKAGDLPSNPSDGISGWKYYFHLKYLQIYKSL